MMMNRIWERYLFRELLKVFFLFLGSFFFLYSLIDASIHMQDFLIDKRIHLSHFLIYHAFQFIKRADMLIPLSLLVATIKVLFSINQHGELVALQAAGLSLKTLLRPFFFLALLCTLFNFASNEFLLPPSLNFLDYFREQHFKHSYHGKRKEPIHVIFMKDRSKIIYQSEDVERKLFFDVFWIKTPDEIWRMKYLTTDPERPVGYFVDQIIRSKDGHFEKVDSHETLSLPPLNWKSDSVGKGYVPVENRTISELFHLLTHKKTMTASELPHVLTYFLQKCMMPLLSILVVIAAAPFCVRYSRSLPIFFVYALLLFGFITFCAYLGASQILGETQIISAYSAILLPFAVCFVGFGWKLMRTR